MDDTEDIDELGPTELPPAPEDPRSSRVLVPRWVQLVALPLGVLGLWTLARAAGPVLAIFLVAGVLALILNPLVSVVHRRRVPRGLAVAIVYLALFALFAAGVALLATPVSDQVQAFQDDVPQIMDGANKSLADTQRYFDRNGINVQIAKPGETALQTLGDRVVGGTGDVVSYGTDILSTVVRAGFGLVLIFVISIYMLLYGQRIGDLVRRVLPPGDGSQEDDYPTRVQRAVASYVRGQLMFSVAMGAGAGVSLYVFGVLGIFPLGKDYALAFGIFFGLMELVPFIGPFLGALPPVLVALFQDPLTALWVALLFLALQQLEGHVVAPQIFSHTLRINPLLVIFALLVGGEIYGFVGALIALPVAAIARETFDYFRRHLVLEDWGGRDPVAVMTDPSSPPGEPDEPAVRRLASGK